MGENRWAILGENRWASLGENHWAPIGEKTWVSIARKMTTASPQEMLPLGVPQILVHGTADDIVPLELSARYHELASALGDRVTFIPLPGMGHFEPIDPQSGAWPRLHAALTHALS
jgi:pimeloyl-ACP methyl ester carboxylesterase